MGHEFDSTDSSGLRSSALYVYEGWMNVAGSYALSQDGILVDDTGDPASDGPVARGYAYDLDAYNVLAAPATC